MKHYTADPHAAHILQIITPVFTLIFIALIWYFFAFLPKWLLWILTVILCAAAFALACLLIPLWFRSISYTVSGTHITKKCGILLLREQTMRTQALQFSTVFHMPGSQKNGLNFIPLHAYGGTVLLAFLRRTDAEEIQVFLQKTVYNHPPESDLL